MFWSMQLGKSCVKSLLMSKRFVFSGLALMAMAALSSPVWAGLVTPVSSTFHLRTEATLGGVLDLVTYSVGQNDTLNPLAGSISSNVMIGMDEASAFANGAATFLSSDAGTVQFDMGWTVVSNVYNFSLNLTDFVSNNWSYTFVSNVNGTFSLDYDVSAKSRTNFVLGLQGFKINWDGLGGGLDISNPFDPTANGVFSRSITMDTMYTISLLEFGNVSGGPTNDFSAEMNALFDWRITNAVVPEPGAFALAFTGALAVGGIRLIRRKHQQTTKGR